MPRMKLKEFRFHQLYRVFVSGDQDGSALTQHCLKNKVIDTYRELLYKYVYALKDLRNAIAHNDVVYDTRFKKMDPSRPMKQCLILEMGMPYINFKTIGDYIILICYYLKLLKVSKTEIKSFIREFEKITREYEASVNPNVSAITIHPDLFSRLGILKNAI